MVMNVLDICAQVQQLWAKGGVSRHTVQCCHTVQCWVAMTLPQSADKSKANN